MLRLPLYPAHPERVCWGCDRHCPAHDLACGNGSERTQHPIELFGDDWVEWSGEHVGDATAPAPSANPVVLAAAADLGAPQRRVDDDASCELHGQDHPLVVSAIGFLHAKRHNQDAADRALHHLTRQS